MNEIIGNATREQLYPVAKESPKTAPWKYDARQYQSFIGVKQPYMMEISQTQIARMSNRRRDQYLDKRSEEWQASADAKTEWKDAVVAAYKAGKFDVNDSNVTEQTKTVIWRMTSDERLEEFKNRCKEYNTSYTLETVEVGDKVFWYCGSLGYGTVVKKFKKSIRVQFADGNEITRDPSQFWALSNKDAKVKVAEEMNVTYETNIQGKITLRAA